MTTTVHQTSIQTSIQKETIKTQGKTAIEKKLLNYCIATHSYIANGRTLGDLRGKYTYHDTPGSSTVDYAVVNYFFTHFCIFFI